MRTLGILSSIWPLARYVTHYNVTWIESDESQSVRVGVFIGREKFHSTNRLVVICKLTVIDNSRAFRYRLKALIGRWISKRLSPISSFITCTALLII